MPEVSLARPYPCVWLNPYNIYRLDFDDTKTVAKFHIDTWQLGKLGSVGTYMLALGLITEISPGVSRDCGARRMRCI